MPEKKQTLKGTKKATYKKAKSSKKNSSKQSLKEPDFDVIVIGTGMGGCAAGAISALHGLKTLILEKNPRPGGNCSYYEKEGFQVDTGTHLFIRGNKGPFGTLTKRLGMGLPLKFIHTKNIVHLMGMNANIIVPKSPIEMLYKFIVPRLAWQLKIHPKHYPSICRLMWSIFFMKPEEIEALDNVSVDDFMCRYTDSAEIRAMIGLLLGLFFILPPWQASAGESIWNMQKLAKEANLGYPKGGAVAIPTTFLRGAEKHGAKVRMNAGVKKILVSDGKANGVVLENDERITSHAVISTTTLRDTVENLTGYDYFPKPYVDRVKGLKPSWTAVQAKIGVKKHLVNAGSLVGGTPLYMKDKFTDETTQKTMAQLENGELLDMIPIYTPIPSNYDPDLAPEGCQLITAVAVAPTLDVELKDKPSAWVDGLMDSLYQMIPNLKENIIFCDTWTVKALSKWIGKTSGSAITTGQTPDQVRFRRPPHETPIKGLYIAGDCGGPARGVGTELACQSGMDCGDLVASHKVNHLLT